MKEQLARLETYSQAASAIYRYVVAEYDTSSITPSSYISFTASDALQGTTEKTVSCCVSGVVGDLPCSGTAPKRNQHTAASHPPSKVVRFI